MMRQGPEIPSRGTWSACNNGPSSHSNLDFWFPLDI